MTENHSDRFPSSVDAQPMRSQCLISFGSNLGDRHDLMAEAARRINQSSLVPQGDVLRTSRLFETPPIGGPGGQDPFLNAVGAFETNASARDILALLQQLEIDLGRQRHRRWAARSIDLDVVLHGELVGGAAELTVPHPRYTARQFVLKPACDIAAHYRDPRFGWTMEKLSRHISAGNASVALVGGDIKTRELLCEQLTSEHGIRTFAAHPLGQPMRVVGNVPAATRKEDVRDAKESGGQPIENCGDEPWVAAYLPSLPKRNNTNDCAANASTVPRLVARLQRTTEETRWPAPHQMWPGGWEWPEYRLEVDDLPWAVCELASALDSMRCSVIPVSANGDWWT